MRNGLGMGCLEGAFKSFSNRKDQQGDFGRDLQTYDMNVGPVGEMGDTVDETAWASLVGDLGLRG